MLKLSIIIVNWNTKDFVCKCLSSLLASTDISAMEIIVVDNGSTDGSVEAIQAVFAPQNFPNLYLVRNEVNLGFGMGSNLGLERAQGDLILFLNPDTEVRADTLSVCTRMIETDSTIGALGCRQWEPGKMNSSRQSFGRYQESCGHFPSLRLMTLQTILNFLSVVRLNHLCGNLAGLMGYRFMPVKKLVGFFDFFHNHEVDWVMGAFLLTRKSILNTVGGFDPSFIMYGEEIDLCRRIQASGFRVIYCGETEITHYGGASTAAISDKADAMRFVAMINIYRKHHGRLAALLYRLMLAFGSAFSWGLCRSSRSKSDSKGVLFKERLRVAMKPTYKGFLK